MMGIRFSGPSEPAPDPAVGRLRGLSAAQGLPGAVLRGRDQAVQEPAPGGQAPVGRGPRALARQRAVSGRLGPRPVDPATGAVSPDHGRRRGDGCGTVSQTERMLVNMGPQHPSTHGVFRMVVALEGETVVGLEPEMGYLHRCHEKIGERNTYLMNIPFTDRLDYISLDVEQPGLRAGGREADGPAGARTRRVHPRDHGRVHPYRQPPDRASASCSTTWAPTSHRPCTACASGS